MTDSEAPRGKAIKGLHRHVRTALEQCCLVADKLLVVAVSGGPDSLAMLYALHHLRDVLGLRLHGAHLNHGLRGDSSEQDALFVAETFHHLGIALTSEEADVSAFRRKHHLSVEQAAREVRYAFLARVAEKQRADAIALGHTADDQAETVLMHIIRGTGLTGLRGMEAISRRDFEGREVQLVRPLLRVSRQETAEYCRALRLEPRLDESNLSRDLKRNQVRLELLPMLQEYNPAIRDALIRLSLSAAQDLAHIEEQVGKVWQETVREEEGDLVVNRPAFSQQPAAVQSHLLRRAVLAAKGDLEDVEHNHIEDMARLMGGPAGRSLDLPGGIRFSVSYYEAALTPSQRTPSQLPRLDCDYPLKIPGETLVPGWRITASYRDRRGRGIKTPDLSRGTTVEYRSEYSAYVDCGSLSGHLWVRSRRPGDRFQPLGMSEAKKLQDFMVDSKIPRWRRDRVPLVVNSRGIVWVVGWRIADWARVRDKEPQQLELTFRSEGFEGPGGDGDRA